MAFYYLLLLLISIVTSLLIGNPLIQMLKSLSIEQTIREDGPQNHIIKKSKTPTIGGLIFLIPFFLIALCIYFLNEDFRSECFLIVMGSTLIMAIVGFVDDYLKVLKKHNKGISGWIKLLIQLLISLVLYYKYSQSSSIIYLIWCFFIFSGASNSYNLTDGLDGLLASISIVSFLGLSILLHFIGKMELACLSIVFLGSLLGFLYFNKYPAKVFMGDTGSLAIGGAIGSLAIVSRSELYLICFATIPILEALSVILQVASCQLSKKFLGIDKRILKMAPLHHHFELSGWKETDVVKRFFVFQFICLLVGILLLYIKQS